MCQFICLFVPYTFLVRQYKYLRQPLDLIRARREDTKMQLTMAKLLSCFHLRNIHLKLSDRDFLYLAYLQNAHLQMYDIRQEGEGVRLSLTVVATRETQVQASQFSSLWQTASHSSSVEASSLTIGSGMSPPSKIVSSLMIMSQLHLGGLMGGTSELEMVQSTSISKFGQIKKSKSMDLLR